MGSKAVEHRLGDEPRLPLTDDPASRIWTSLCTSRLNALRAHSSAAVPAASANPAAIPRCLRTVSRQIPLVGQPDPGHRRLGPASRTPPLTDSRRLSRNDSLLCLSILWALLHGAAVSTLLYCRRNRVALSRHRRKPVSPVDFTAERKTMERG